MTRRVLVIIAIVGCGHDRAPTDETRAREAWTRDLAHREGLDAAWSLASRSDLSFEDGLGPVETVDPDIPSTDWRAQKPVRWMGPRSHLRVRGDDDMRLEVTGRIDLGKVFTRPLVTLTLGGRELATVPVDDAGEFAIRTVIPRGQVSGWTDLYITLSSVNEPTRDPAATGPYKLEVARLEHVVWEPMASRPPEP